MATQPRIYIDLVRDVFLTEHAGETVEARRLMVLVGVSDRPSIMENSKMFPQLPLPGDVLNARTDPEMILEDRAFRVVSWDEATGTAKVRVEMIYRRQRTDLTPQRGGTALEQITSEVDKNGAAITVEHGGVTQGGHITVLTPRSTYSTESIEETDDPERVVLRWLGKINSVAWHNGHPKTWLIVRADWELADAFSDPPVYHFTWEMEYRREKWDPITVAYKDPQTGERPVGLVEGTGLKDINWYDAVSFTAKFGRGRTPR